MNYENQLVLNGKINNVGEFIRENSGKSYRLGLELAAFANLSEKWQLSGNVTFSDNKNKNFKQETDEGIVDFGNTQTSFSPNFMGNFLIKFKPNSNFNFGIQNKYVGSQFLDNSNNDNLKLEGYFLSDFNAQYSLKFKKTDVDFKFLLNNIFDKKYINNGFVYDESPYYYFRAACDGSGKHLFAETYEEHLLNECP